MPAFRGISYGTVATRIRAFQDPRPSPEHTSVRPSPLMGHLLEPDTLVSYGRRKQESCASPAERTSRDTTDGSKGDGRPPVRSTDLEFCSSSVREATALAESSPPPDDLALDDPFIASKDGPSSPPRGKPPNPLEGPRSELERARARLRPIAACRKLTPTKSEDDVSSTLAELGFMIDTALDEHRSDDTPYRSPDGVARRPSVQSATQVTMLRGVDEPQRHGRLFTQYHSQLAANRAQPMSSPTHHPPTLSLSGLLSSPSAVSPETRLPHLPVHPEARADAPRPSSPVRERAAIFENLAAFREEILRPRSPPPRAHLHEKEEWSKIPHHLPTEEEEARMHNAKFGRSISERTPVMGIESSGDTEGTYDTAHQIIESVLPGDQSSPPPSESRRAPSRGWPVQVRTSSKTGVSRPQPFHAAASPHERDAHHPLGRPSIVSQRIAQLALAGLEATPKSRSRTTSSIAVDSESAKVTESELRDHNMDGGLLLPHHVAPLQVPVQEEADDPVLVPKSFRNARAVRTNSRDISHRRCGTPISKCRLEKHTVSLSRPTMNYTESGSPVTPVRGRSVMSRAARGSGYGVEQSFYFAPGKSRSPSGGSGRRLTLQINMGTPDRQSMEKVVIKADMDVLEEA